MSKEIGCHKCSHLCIERSFLTHQEWLSWMADERILEEGGIFDVVYGDVSLVKESMTAEVKCVGCGQVFMLTANTFKSNKIKVVASWKPVPPATLAHD